MTGMRSGCQIVKLPAVTRANRSDSAGAHLRTADVLRRVIDLPADLDDFTAEGRIAAFLAWAKLQRCGQGYVARHRRAWWSVGLKKPAPLCTYMATRVPQFTLNICGARHINIAHGLYPREPLSAQAMSQLVAWLNKNVNTAGGRSYAGGIDESSSRKKSSVCVFRNWRTCCRDGGPGPLVESRVRRREGVGDAVFVPSGWPSPMLDRVVPRAKSRKPAPRWATWCLKRSEDKPRRGLWLKAGRGLALLGRPSVLRRPAGSSPMLIQQRGVLKQDPCFAHRVRRDYEHGFTAFPSGWHFCGKPPTKAAAAWGEVVGGGVGAADRAVHMTGTAQRWQDNQEALVKGLSAAGLGLPGSACQGDQPAGEWAAGPTVGFGMFAG